jgi:uncharacterized hydrophobic protein (TIGR00271 family)
MPDYVDNAVFIYDHAGFPLVKEVMGNCVGAKVVSIPLQAWLDDPGAVLADAQHVVIAAAMGRVKQLLLQSMDYGFSIGILPIAGHRKMSRFLDLPDNPVAAVEHALRSGAPAMDLVLCNGKVMLFRATIGWLPLFDEPPGMGRVEAVLRALGKLVKIQLRRVNIITGGGKVIKTSAIGCMVVQRHQGSLGSRLTERATSISDAAVGLVVMSPRSVLQYLQFLLEITFSSTRHQRLPAGIGFIRSNELRLETTEDQDVFIDGVRSSRTPVECRVLPAATRVNVGPGLCKAFNSRVNQQRERLQIDDLPNKKELTKSLSKRVPIFSYASVDRFRDLFRVLRQDAELNMNYVVLMVLSTMLATVGLYLDSAAVIIGAMLLAPLMAPLVSASMGILRADNDLFFTAVRTIIVGIVIALFSAALTTLMFQHKPVTDEMLGRLNPSLLDLAVAIFSGMAAAYSKSFQQVAQNLAGVAIAVALVPPLAVAGIGIGRGDPFFFMQAFLLFMTNLVGIILSAMFTFRVLGYSPVVRNKQGLMAMLLLLAVISIPLYASYHQIVDQIVFEQSLETDRFLVNGKYVMVKNVKVSSQRGRPLLVMDILAREPLTREDLQKLKGKLRNQFRTEWAMHTTVIYLL